MWGAGLLQCPMFELGVQSKRGSCVFQQLVRSRPSGLFAHRICRNVSTELENNVCWRFARLMSEISRFPLFGAGGVASSFS